MLNALLIYYLVILYHNSQLLCVLLQNKSYLNWIELSLCNM